MAAAAQIQVTGLKELRKSLRKFETDVGWRPGLREAYQATAATTEAASRSSAAGSRMGSQALATIKGKGTTTGATLKGGSNTVVWFAGHNFGSTRYRQFPPKASPDYHMYAVIERERGRIEADFLTAVDKALSGEGL